MHITPMQMHGIALVMGAFGYQGVSRLYHDRAVAAAMLPERYSLRYWQSQSLLLPFLPERDPRFMM